CAEGSRDVRGDRRRCLGGCAGPVAGADDARLLAAQLARPNRIDYPTYAGGTDARAAGDAAQGNYSAQPSAARAGAHAGAGNGRHRRNPGRSCPGISDPWNARSDRMGVLTTSETLLATEPLYLLINQHYQVSRQPGSTQALDRDTHDPLWRRCV